MAARVYATSEDLADCDFLPAGLTVPADADRLLGRASRVIDRLLAAALYDVDDDGMPTDIALVEVLRDAACAQACWWLETGDEQGVASQLDSVGAGSGPYVNGRLSRIAPDAAEVLRLAVDSGGSPLLVGGPWQG